jgi:hypothetical protein
MMPLCQAVTERRERRLRHRSLERELAAFTSPAELSELDALLAATPPAAGADEIRDILYRQAMTRLLEPRMMHLFRVK